EGGQRNTASYDQIAPTPGTENGAVVVGGIAEIFEIQGDSFVSPFENTIVTSENNVVTAVGPEGFFMQTPADRTDGLENTSDGIYVFLEAAPSVSVGDLVTVTGTVVEFFDFTEFTDVTEVLVTGTGTVPEAIVFDETLPSPNQPQDDTEYEQYEGMLVTIANGYVTGPSQSFGSDPEAEAYIVASGEQTFREPGIEFPGLTGLPVWDGNPEVFELDPDKLGLDNVLLPLGSTFSATGALGYEFGGYELWASELTANVATLPGAVRAASDTEGTVASLNLFRLFDDVADGNETVVDLEEYQTRLVKFSSYIRDVLSAPDIIAVQEAEKLGVLEDLAAQIQNDDGSLIYDAYLVEGNDVGGIDVGFLVRPSAVQVNAVTQLAADELLTFDGSLLHDRPPLLLEADFLLGGAPAFPIEVLAVHNRSLSGIDDDGSGERVRTKRLEQAQSIATIVQARQDANADVRLTVVGDFNAYEFSDGYVDAVGQIRGVFNPDDNLLSGDDLVDPDLTNQVLNLPEEERYSFIFRGTSQVLDHALTSVALDPFVNDFAFGRGNAGAPLILLDDDTTPLRASDHDGLVLYVEIQPALPGTAVLAAANSMYVGFNSYINSGDLLVQGAGDETLVTGYELAIGKRSVTADGFTLKADDILVLPQALVASDVAYNTLENLGTVTGEETTPLALPVFEFPAFQTGTPTDDVLIVQKNQTVSIDADAYGHILVRQNGTLILTGGEYDVASLTMYRGSEMRYEAAGAMRVAGRVETQKSVDIGPADASVADASTFVLYVEGMNGENGGLFEKPAAVDLGKSAEVQVNIFAPNGSIVMNELVTATGAFLAKDVWLERNVSITLDSHWAADMSQATVAAANAGSDELLLEQTAAALPEEYALTQNYPNPFNPTTTIPFSLPEAGHVTLKVYDMLGRLVDTLVDREMNAGYHNAAFNARSYPSGAYIYRLEVNNFASVKKMMLVK
ncbi:MAG: T9SS type A sorting domain-containing protein, partial [Bacteroidota bacterium]